MKMPMNEPSVLDYIKSKIAPWKYPPVVIPSESSDETEVEKQHPIQDIQPTSPPEEIDQPTPLPQLETAKKEIPNSFQWPWITILALILAIFAQYSLEPSPNRDWMPGLMIFAIALGLGALAFVKGEWKLSSYRIVVFREEPQSIRPYLFIAGILIALISFATFGGNRFTLFNITLLIISLILILWSLWIPMRKRKTDISKIRTFISQPQWNFRISKWTALVSISFLSAAFFRFSKLSQVPPEMNSDHAEKILDVIRVLNGQTMIFFPTNGGREALQFYLVAALHKFFNVSLDFVALKSVTTAVGFLALPFIYLLGKELVNKRVGLISMLLAGIAYWPNVVSRAGMRLPFYILFTSMVMYFLLKGIRTGRRNYFILTGIALGISFYGYSADRILPLLVIIAVALFLLHKHSKQHGRQVIISTILLLIIASVIFLPLLRYMLEDPNSFLFRTLSRMGTMERPLPGPAWKIFLSNLGRATLMFSWDNGEIWPVSVPHRPALDIVTGALFWLGVILIIVRYIRERNWLDILLLLSIPILMLPSTLSLAFPAENPNLYRTGGALIPVFLIIGISLEGVFQSFTYQGKRLETKFAWGLIVILIALSGVLSYRLVFKEYNHQYTLSAWNSSEMAETVEDFTNTIGDIEDVWVMAYPYWVDTRLIGIIAGYPTKNFVIFPEDLNNLPEDSKAKLFLIKPEDEEAISLLLEKYPNGWMQEYNSKVAAKNFLLFFVPPTN
jgi:hypothetical protein